MWRHDGFEFSETLWPCVSGSWEVSGGGLCIKVHTLRLKPTLEVINERFNGGRMVVTSKDWLVGFSTSIPTKRILYFGELTKCT
jgi:hypothetical protein